MPLRSCCRSPSHPISACARLCFLAGEEMWRPRPGAWPLLTSSSFEIPYWGPPTVLMPSVVLSAGGGKPRTAGGTDQNGRDRADRFARAGVEGGVSCSTEVRTGIPSDVIAQESIAHDLVIMARSGYGRAPRSDEAQVDSLVFRRDSQLDPARAGGRQAFPASGAIRSMIVAFDAASTLPVP